MLDHVAVDQEICPIALSLDVLGQKWTLLIIRDALRGARRFSEFQRTLGCPRNLLSARLRLLCDHGVLRQAAYVEPGRRGRVLYELTDAGRELAPMLIVLRDWGMRHMQLEPHQRFADPSRCACGATTHVAVECEAAHRQTSPGAIEFPPLPTPTNRA